MNMIKIEKCFTKHSNCNDSKPLTDHGFDLNPTLTTIWNGNNRLQFSSFLLYGDMCLRGIHLPLME